MWHHTLGRIELEYFEGVTIINSILSSLSLQFIQGHPILDVHNAALYPIDQIVNVCHKSGLMKFTVISEALMQHSIEVDHIGHRASIDSLFKILPYFFSVFVFK